MITQTARRPMERSEYIAQLREALNALESGEEARFEQTLDALLRSREDGLFAKVARLTRQLHQAVQEFRQDDRLAQAAGDIPDAVSRLDYVVQVMEKAAHDTLDLVEKSRHVAIGLSQVGVDVANIRESLLHKARNPAALDVNLIANRLYAIQGHLQRDTAELRGHLMHLAQAQEYQDLTGQIIKRVIALVRKVEGALLDLLRASGSDLQNLQTRPITPLGGELQGPAVPRQSAASQQDADELLASLGF